MYRSCAWYCSLGILFVSVFLVGFGLLFGFADTFGWGLAVGLSVRGCGACVLVGFSVVIVGLCI